MPSPAEIARQHYETRSRLVSAVAGEADRLWRQVDPDRIGTSWLSLLTRLLVVLVGAQRAAAGRADDYLDAVLTAQNVSPRPRGKVYAAALSGMASDGRDLAELLYRPAVIALVGIRDGGAIDRAMASGSATLDMITRTQVADAGRVADLVATAARPASTVYVRMLVGGSCPRCVILAGQRYQWNAGFDRHPRCDCVGIPSREDLADDLCTDPKAYFRSLSTADQDRLFTKAGAEAIREGADMNQVVNARRGMTTAGVSRTRINEQGLVVNERRRTQATRRLDGQDVFTTRTGATTRGLAGQRLGAQKGKPAVRLMPEEIFRQANGDRDDAIRLLRQHGYLI